MREKKFTEGPWIFKATGTRRYIKGNPTDGSAEVCEINESWIKNDTSVANAQLISAAPELLEACEFLAEVIDSMANAIRTGVAWGMVDIDKRSAKADAAIAKAYGETP